MGLFQAAFHFGLHVPDAHARLHREADHVDAVAQVVHLLHRGVGQGDGLRGLALYVDVALRRAHADDLVVHAVHLHVPSARVAPVFEEALVHALADDAYLAPLADVHVVDEAAIGHLLVLQPLVVGVQAADVALIFVALVHRLLAPLRDARRGHGHARDGGHALHVVNLQVPPAPLAEAPVRLVRLARHGEARVGGEAFELLLQFLLHTPSAPAQGHEHEDAPKHPEGRQQAARLVAGDGDEDFLYGISVYFHPI